MQHADINGIKAWADRVSDALGGVFFGQEEAVDKILSALLARGHVLIEDVPGTGKTILARAAAALMGVDFGRIQCTPDLLPADVLGVSVYSPETGKFSFREGPVMTNILLVDEINRATPRTQSALLEAMGERQVSVEGRRVALEEPFFVLATENPVEFEGTFPLPEAQRDRFMLALSLGYPSREAEALILESQRRLGHPVEDLKPVCEGAEILRYQAEAVKVHVDASVRDYMLALAAATRVDPALRLGVSPRGSLALYKLCQAWAAINGRDYVVPEDVKVLATDVFRKRIVLRSESALKSIRPERVIQSILDTTEAPSFKERV